MIRRLGLLLLTVLAVIILGGPLELRIPPEAYGARGRYDVRIDGSNYGKHIGSELLAFIFRVCWLLLRCCSAAQSGLWI